MANASEGFVGLFSAVDKLIEVESLLTFILVFTLVYAIFQKTKIIGEGRKNFNLVVSLVIALFTVIPHLLGSVSANNDPVLIITSALPNVSVVVVAILGVLVLIGVFGKNVDIVGTSLGGIVAIAAFLTVAFIFGSAAGWWNGFPPFLGFLNDQDTQSVLITILVFAIIIWFITKDDSVTVDSGLGGFLRGISRSIK